MLRPIKNNVIVELIEKDKVTGGGIILSRTDPMEANRGKVVVGSVSGLIKVGEEVLPDWNKAQKMPYEGKDYYVVSEDDVVLIFED